MPLGLILMLLTLAGGQQFQPLPIGPGSSSISGTVIDAVTKAPLAEVAVRLSMWDGISTHAGTAHTDQRGQYEFANIAEGNYSMTAESNDHLFSCYLGTAADPSRCWNVRLARDQRLTGVNFALTPGATLRGRVVNSSGQPVAGATIRVSAPRAGIAVAQAGGGRTRADGSFELARLEAGEWTIELDVPAAAGAVRHPLVYYPGVIERDAARIITLSPGEILGNVDFVLPDLSANKLTLRVHSPGPDVSDVAAAVIRAAPLMTACVGVDAYGLGHLGGLLPGRYFAAARTTMAGRVFTAFRVIDFSGGSQDVILALQPAAVIAGRIVARRGSPPSLDGVRVAAAWTHDDVEVNPLVPDQVVAAPDGSFRIDGLFGRRVMQLVGLDPAWSVVSVRQGRRDVTRGVAVAPGTTTTVTIVLARRY
jgi:hypothetical protein